MIPPCLILSNIRYVSRVKWSNPGKGVAPSPSPQCSSYWKGSLLVALDNNRQVYFLLTLYLCGIFCLSTTTNIYLKIVLVNWFDFVSLLNGSSNFVGYVIIVEVQSSSSSSGCAHCTELLGSFSHRPSLSSIFSGRYSRQHQVSAQNWSI